MPNAYRPVTEAVVAELRSIVGAAHVLFDDPSALEAFAHDEIPDRRYAHMPEVVVNPRCATEIAAIMQLANRECIPVTPRGAGSGLSGGAVPLHGGIVLRSDRQNQILEIDLDNMIAVVEPGVITAQINERLADSGFFYAGYPMSQETCFVGGNVAENAGGGKAVKYGVTARYVLGLEIVTPTGQIVQLGGKLIKDVTGYNLVQLMVGSEGTLGVFTKVYLRLIPKPRASVDLLCAFADSHTAVAVVPRLMAATGITPTAIEFIDARSFAQSCRYLNETLPYRESGAVLIVTVDGPDEGQVERDYESIGRFLQENGACEVYVADNKTTSERIWMVRRSIAESYAQISPHQANEDLVVPPAAIPALVEGMQALAEEFGVHVPAYGHAGDGNIHTRIVKNPEWSLVQWESTLPLILDRLYALTAQLGGRLSGEHGIGHKRKQYMDRFVSAEYIELMRALKRAWDPLGVMNPGKIFD